MAIRLAGCIVVIVCLACVVGCRNRAAETPAEPNQPTAATATSEVPILNFPAEVRSDNPEINAFVERMVDAFRNEDYQAYRQMVTRHVEPIGRGNFSKAWLVVERITITTTREITITDQMRQASDHPLVKLVAEGPVYLIEGVVEIKPEAERDTQYPAMFVFREADRWVMAPAPRSLAAAVSTTQPATASP